MLPPSETAMPAAGYKCKLPLYSLVLVRDGQEWMEAAVREEVSEKEARKSIFSASPAGLCVRMCVSWLVSHWQPWCKGPAARVLALCLDHHTFSGTKEESSCCPPSSSSANKQRGGCASVTGRVNGNLHSRSV